MSDGPKRHHYVPSVYLKGFSDADGYITTVEKPSGKFFKTAPHNTALIKHHNTVRFSDGTHDSTTIEASFAKIESDFSDAMNEVRNRVADARAVQAIILFAAAQRGRTPTARKLLTKVFDMMQQVLSEETALKTLRDEEVLLWQAAQAGDNSSKEQVALQASGHLMLASAAQMDRMGFLIIETRGVPQLITSDNPVTMFSPNERSKKVKMPVPDGRRTICIFPLDQKRIFFGDTDLVGDYLAYGLRYMDLSERKNIVSNICRATAISAEKYIFSDLFPRREIRSYELKSINRRNRSFSNLQIEYSKLLHQVVFAVSKGKIVSDGKA